MTLRTTRWATMANRAALVALACGVLIGGSPAQGATFRWSPDTQGIVVEPNALRQVVSGVTVRASGYTVEYTATTTRVFGPYPTGISPHCPPLKIFGVDVRRYGLPSGEDLGLISQPLPGIGVGGFDCKNSASPGFDSLQYKSPLPNTITKLDMALFEFSQPIRVNSVTVEQVSSSFRQIWVAACSAAPNFIHGLTAAIAACTVRNSNDIAGGADFTHPIGLAAVRYFLVGARPNRLRPNANALARITAGLSHYYIEAIDFTK